MKKYFHALFVFACLLSVNAYAEDIDTSKLIKVDSQNHEKCIEYYNYNKELYCSTTKLNDEELNPNLKDDEKLAIVFDQRPWRLAWGKQDSSITTLEYVANNEPVEHWNELITSQFFPDIQDKATLKEFAETFIDNFKKNGFDPVVNFREESDNRIIFELQISQPENQIQDILVLMLKDDKGVYVLQYAVKKLDMGKTARNLWVDNFKQTKIR